MDKIDLGAHIFSTGQGVIYRAGPGTDIDGLEDGGLYYVVALDSTTVQLALTEDDALADTPVVIDIDLIADGGSGSLSEIDALRQGSKWTEDQLRYSIGGG